MTLTEKQIDDITLSVAANFRCFGGGRDSDGFNPLVDAMKDQPLAFAAMVPVADVVRFVAECITGK